MFWRGELWRGEGFFLIFPVWAARIRVLRLSIFLLLAPLFVMTLLMLPLPVAYALLEIDITEGNVQPLPIAIPDFRDDVGDDLGRKIAGVISSDLERSGLFSIIDKAVYPKRAGSGGSNPSFAYWQGIKAETLLIGHVTSADQERVRLAFRLWDVFSEREMASQQFFSAPGKWRRVSHLISDMIYQRMTGETGYFDSRIVFVSETGPKGARVKRLAIMDQDGANLDYLTDGRDLVLTPRFSPDGRKVVYMSFQDGGRPRVSLLDVQTRRRMSLGNFSDMTFAPRFSPDGHRVVMSLQSGGNANIYTVDLKSRAIVRLTDTLAIDTAPSYSPDARFLAFESDRGGRQQIYVMNADGSNQHRISFGDGSYSTPVWSPRGDLIAFTKRVGGQFKIGVMRPDGKGERLLTEGYHNEGPSWAPNGRVLLFFREKRGVDGGPQLWSIDLTGYNERRIPTPAFASDPSWSVMMTE